MSESRFEAGRSWKGTRMDSLARGLYDIADEGYQDKTAAEIIAEMRERLVGELLPLLEATQLLVDQDYTRTFEFTDKRRVLRKELATWQKR